MSKFKVNGQLYTHDDFCFDPATPLASMIEYWLMHSIEEEYDIDNDSYASLVDMMTAFANSPYAKAISVNVDGDMYEFEKV